MSIRRIGFNPFVNTAALIEAQKRIEAVEKHAGTEDTEVMTEEEALASLNAQQQAELDAIEAERLQREQESAELRAKLMLADGYEAAPKELVDLKGGVEERAASANRAGAGKPGVSLAHLARANVYESVSRAERAEAERAALQAQAQAQAEAERAAAEAAAASVDGGGGVEDNSWMEEELSALQGEMEAEELDGAEETYSDPGADSFFASLEDIENLEQGGAGLDDPYANDFVASLDDIAHLVPETAPEATLESAPEAAFEPVPVDSFEAAPEVLEPGGVGAPVAGEPSVMLAEDVAASPVDAAVEAPVHGGSAEVSSVQPETKPVGLPFDDEA